MENIKLIIVSICLLLLTSCQKRPHLQDCNLLQQVADSLINYDFDAGEIRDSNILLTKKLSAIGCYDTVACIGFDRKYLAKISGIVQLGISREENRIEFWCDGANDDVSGYVYFASSQNKNRSGVARTVKLSDKWYYFWTRN